MEYCAKKDERLKREFLKHKQMVDDIVDIVIHHDGSIRQLAEKIVTEVFECL